MCQNRDVLTPSLAIQMSARISIPAKLYSLDHIVIARTWKMKHYKVKYEPISVAPIHNTLFPEKS